MKNYQLLASYIRQAIIDSNNGFPASARKSLDLAHSLVSSLTGALLQIHRCDIDKIVILYADTRITITPDFVFGFTVKMAARHDYLLPTVRAWLDRDGGENASH